MVHLAFLHTAPANEALFTSILKGFSPDLPVCHRVEPELLAKALAAGQVTPAVEVALADGLKTLRQGGAGLVVCTCSTLGAAVEAQGARLQVPVLRIDRPMAEQAVRIGANILVAACVKSTLGPTCALLSEAADGLAKAVRLNAHLVDDAWPLFEAGDHDRYAARIAQAVESNLSDHDAVVLTQASMAPAAELCGQLGVPVLSSPLLGAQEAVRRFECLCARSP